MRPQVPPAATKMAEQVYGAREFISSRIAEMTRGKEEIIEPTGDTEETEYLNIFEDVQQYIVREKLAELNESLDKGEDELLKTLTSSYLQKKYPNLIGNPKKLNNIITKCIADMTGYGFLNAYFARKDEIEEININAWDTVEVRWCTGKREITHDKFHSAQHARDVIIRILRSTGKYLDENKIYEISYIGKSVRIATVITPIVDKEIGVAASIRFIHSAVYTLDKLIDTGFLTKEMGDTLYKFLRHGVSICVCGSTGSGKTTVCNALLEDIPDDTRVITLEGGTREFELVKRDKEGHVLNNRVHMQTRPHKDAKLNVDLQLLLDLVLKFDPEVVVVGEMVSEEAFIASETARTGHTVMTTVHTNNAYDAYYRMFSLGIRKYDLSETTMLKFMVDAFPIIAYAKMYPDGKRRLQSVLEGHYKDGKIIYNELFHYNVEDNIENEDGTISTLGQFVHPNRVTDELKEFMMNNGATRAQVAGI